MIIETRKLGHKLTQRTPVSIWTRIPGVYTLFNISNWNYFPINFLTLRISDCLKISMGGLMLTTLLRHPDIVAKQNHWVSALNQITQENSTGIPTNVSYFTVHKSINFILLLFSHSTVFKSLHILRLPLRVWWSAAHQKSLFLFTGQFIVSSRDQWPISWPTSSSSAAPRRYVIRLMKMRP